MGRNYLEDVGGAALVVYGCVLHALLIRWIVLVMYSGSSSSISQSHPAVAIIIALLGALFLAIHPACFVTQEWTKLESTLSRGRCRRRPPKFVRDGFDIRKFYRPTFSLFGTLFRQRHASDTDAEIGNGRTLVHRCPIDRSGSDCDRTANRIYWGRVGRGSETCLAVA